MMNQANMIKQNTQYFKQPCTGFYSKITQYKLKSLIQWLCTNLEITLVFLPYKIKNLFSFKDLIPGELKSYVGCNSCYIGKTTRHLTTQINEHTQTDTHLHIFKHLKKSSACKHQYDSNKSVLSLKLKEALYIKKLKPKPNIKVHHCNTMFSL